MLVVTCAGFSLPRALCVSGGCAQSPALAGIAHIAFRVRDVAKSRDFYRKLGFEQSFEFADPGKPSVSYIKVNDRQFIELYGRTDESTPTGLMHVCYEVEDIEALRQEDARRGLNPTENRKARAGNFLFVLHDPEGQLLEYTEYLPGSLRYEDRGKHLGEHRVGEYLLRTAIAVKDFAAERAFYTQKLELRQVNANGGILLRLLGNSGDEVELNETHPSTKPKIALAISDMKSAAKELRRRGLDVRTANGIVWITDPDGAIIELLSSEPSGGDH